jgi:hypothetical protein
VTTQRVVVVRKEKVVNVLAAAVWAPCHSIWKQHGVCVASSFRLACFHQQGYPLCAMEGGRRDCGCRDGHVLVWCRWLQRLGGPGSETMGC